ncbi:MAG: hypothetical protein ABWZ64_17355 [Xanthobacteraceae bacterium]
MPAALWHRFEFSSFSDHVVLMRAIAGIKMTIALPLHSYLGIALHFAAEDGG